MSRFKLIALVIVALLGAIIVFQNTEPVGTRILFFTLSMPRAVLLLLTTVIGFTIGVLVSFLAIKKNQ